MRIVWAFLTSSIRLEDLYWSVTFIRNANSLIRIRLFVILASYASAINRKNLIYDVANIRPTYSASFICSLEAFTLLAFTVLDQNLSGGTGIRDANKGFVIWVLKIIACWAGAVRQKNLGWVVASIGDADTLPICFVEILTWVRVVRAWCARAIAPVNFILWGVAIVLNAVFSGISSIWPEIAITSCAWSGQRDDLS